MFRKYFFPFLALVYFSWMTVGVVLLTTERLQPWRARFEVWADVASLFLGASLTAFLIRRDASLKRTLIAIGAVFLLSGLVEWIGVRTGLPFGQYMYTPRLGPQFGPLPLILPACWLILVLNAYLLCAVLISPKLSGSDGGMMRALCGAMMVTLIDLNLEPVAANVKHYWLWLDRDLFYYGVPRLNFLGWYGVSLFLMMILNGILGPVKFRASTAWWSWTVLVMIQCLFAILNWQARQFVPVVVTLNLMGAIAIALSLVARPSDEVSSTGAESISERPEDRATPEANVP